MLLWQILDRYMYVQCFAVWKVKQCKSGILQVGVIRVCRDKFFLSARPLLCCSVILDLAASGSKVWNFSPAYLKLNCIYLLIGGMLLSSLMTILTYCIILWKLCCVTWWNLIQKSFTSRILREKTKHCSDLIDWHVHEKTSPVDLPESVHVMCMSARIIDSHHPLRMQGVIWIYDLWNEVSSGWTSRCVVWGSARDWQGK